MYRFHLSSFRELRNRVGVRAGVPQAQIIRLLRKRERKKKDIKYCF